MDDKKLMNEICDLRIELKAERGLAEAYKAEIEELEKEKLGLEYDLQLAKEELLCIIESQKAEIKQKDTEIDILIRKKETLKDELAEKQAEIERLKPFEEKIAEYNSSIRVEDMLVFASSLEEWLEFCDDLKAEAYKEFAERLKNHFWSKADCDVLIRGVIDNLLTELTEGEAGDER